jgi:surface protein
MYFYQWWNGNVEEVTLQTVLEELGDSIRNVSGTTDPIALMSMSYNLDTAIQDYVKPEGTLPITDSGEYNVRNYDSVNVDIPKGTDTSDANATSSDLLLGKTAYVDGQKIEGSIETYDYSSSNNSSNGRSLKKLLDYTKSMYHLFANNTNIQSLGDILDYNDTENVTNMKETFYYCRKLKELPLLNTKNVTTMEGLFYECDALTTLPLLDTHNVTNMAYFAIRCDNLVEVPLLDTSNVTDMQHAFQECKKIVTLPLWDTHNVTNMTYFCSECSELETFPQIDTSKVVNMNHMIAQCKKIKTLPQLNTNSVTDLSYAFSYCDLLEKVDITHYNISSTDKVNYCWYADHSLKTLIIRSFGNGTTLSTSSLDYCNHMNGTVDSTYNPDGLKDGYIYVPKNMVNYLKKQNVWSNYASQIRPIFDIDNFGPGTITTVSNNSGETIVTATQNEGKYFKGWYTGTIEKDFIPLETTPSAYESLNTTYTFELNEDGYYQNTNQNKGSSYALCRFRFTITDPSLQVLKLTYLQSSEQNYDYGVIGKVDTALSKDTNDGTYYMKLYGKTITTPESTVIEGLSVGDHFIDIKYKKDGSGDTGTDTFQIKVEVVIQEEVKLSYEGEFYSSDTTLNLGVVDEMIIDPINLIAVFEEE